MNSPSNNFKRPQALRSGDSIAIIAPASPFDREAFLRGVARISAWGFKIKFREDIFAKKRFLAGSDERRAEELIEALDNPEVKAIFVARGGYGSQRLLPFLDKIPAPQNPKILLGYSDLTSLHIYAQQRWDWVTFHGPVVAKDLSERVHAAGEASLLRALTQAEPLGFLTTPELCALVSGEVSGLLVGGCLSLIICSLGTPYQIKTYGKILYLEDVGEILYSLDRMLTHLRLAGIFDGVKGLVFGPLKEAHEDPQAVKDVLQESLADLNIPILFGFPSGHCEDSWTIPLNIPVVLKTDPPGLLFEESALEDFFENSQR